MNAKSQVLLRPLQVPEPDRLVNRTDPVAEPKFTGRMDPVLPPQGGGSDSGGFETTFSYPMFRDLEREGAVRGARRAPLLRGDALRW